MAVAPGLEIGDGYAIFRGGPVADGGLHQHAAFQIAAAADGEVSMFDASGVEHRGPALLVPPLVWHRLPAVADLTTIFVEPQSGFADTLRALSGGGITVAPALRELGTAELRAVAARPRRHLDPRLRAAMTAVLAPDVDVTAAAAAVGLSPQRLRSLARAQLGMPLVRWRTWRRLAAAVAALRAGEPLARAAISGGFADQAHFTRRMRVMMGLTPAAVLRALGRPSAAPRTPRSNR